MEKLSGYAFVAAMLSTVLATIAYVLYAVSGLRAARLQTAGMPTTTGTLGWVSGPRTAAIGRYATMLSWLALFALGAGLVFLLPQRRVWARISSRGAMSVLSVASLGRRDAALGTDFDDLITDIRTALQAPAQA